MRTILVSVSLLLLVRGCASQKAEKQYNIGEIKYGEFIEIESKTIKGVIVPKEHFRDPNGEGHWTIKDFDFEDLENRLEKYLRKVPLDDWNKDLPDKFRKYKRQYIGRIVDGKKTIFINFFCEHFDGDYWKRDLVMVLDGGDCFFNVEYNPQTREFSKLSINGRG
jgi:hypothetical protein